MRSGWMLAFLLVQCVAAQDSTRTSISPEDSVRWIRRNAVYVEGWGVSSIASVNYERLILRRGKISLLSRAGIGTIHLRDFTRRLNPDLIMPFGLYTTLGRQWGPEVGGGGAFTSIVYPDPDSFDPERIQRLHGWCSVGLRTIDAWSPAMLRVAATWIFTFDRVEYAVGLGVGYQF